MSPIAEFNNWKTRLFLHARVYKNGCATFQHPPGLATNLILMCYSHFIWSLILQPNCHFGTQMTFCQPI